jgi:hypothetical protein
MESPFDNVFPLGFRIVGSCQNDRRLVDWSAAFLAYCDCDDRAEVENEAYLSAFCFGRGFEDLLNRTGSTRGYAGECWSAWLWFDIDDRNDLESAKIDAGKLAGTLVERYELTGNELMIFFSGSKGFHIGLPLAVCGSPGPSSEFNAVSRRLAEQVATLAGVVIDSGVYDRVRAFRAPNSRHPKTGLHKRILTLDELLMLRIGKIVELAADPIPFNLPKLPPPNPLAVKDWHSAFDAVKQTQVSLAERRANGTGATGLNRLTLEFIRDGATTGDRHRTLFSAAANLAEFGCSFELAFALLREAALDSGLALSDVRRQIECGLKHERKP